MDHGFLLKVQTSGLTGNIGKFSYVGKFYDMLRSYGEYF